MKKGFPEQLSLNIASFIQYLEEIELVSGRCTNTTIAVNLRSTDDASLALSPEWFGAGSSRHLEHVCDCYIDKIKKECHFYLLTERILEIPL